MDNDLDENVGIVFPNNQKNVIINKEIKVIDLLNKKVQVSYHLN
tara:strand:- start:308 stop:439 length:132 start_codon:yes stop_codon:yes gene_type:complete